MFDLENSIQEWRSHLKKKTSIHFSDLNELETHIHEKTEVLIKAGKSPKEAFDQAIKEFGDIARLQQELEKNISQSNSLRSLFSIQTSNFKVILRKLAKKKVYSAVNIFGLAIGIAVASLLMKVVLEEANYETHHNKADRIYSVLQHWNFGTYELTDTSIPPAYGPDIQSDYPEVEAAIRVWRWNQPLIGYGVKSFYESKFVFADSGLFEHFDFQFLKGDGEIALNEPYSVVLNERTALKYFGTEDPIGKSIQFTDIASSRVISNKAFNGKNLSFTVTGVIQNAPNNTDLDFNFIASFSSFGDAYDDERWSSGPMTFLLLSDSEAAIALEKKLSQFINKHIGETLENSGQSTYLMLVPLRDLHARFAGGNSLLIVLSLTALAVLALACINFMNLTIASGLQRIKEVGVRKFTGATKGHLIGQFLFESIFMSALAMLVGIIFIKLGLPYFNALLEKNFTFHPLEDIQLLLGEVLFVLVAGFVAGIYPALYLSNFRASAIFNSSAAPSRKNRFHKTLIVSQFVVAFIFITLMLVLNDQLNYVQNKDLGFDKNRLLIIPHWSKEMALKEFESFRRKIENKAGVQSISLTSQYPGYAASSETYVPEGLDESIRLDNQWGDANFFGTFGFHLVAGSPLDANSGKDNVVINETAVERFGWGSPQDAIGRFLDNNLQVTGVVKDFNIFSVHRKIEPTAIRILDESLEGNYNNYFVAVKLDGGEINQAVTEIESLWKEFFPGSSFDFTFLDSQFDQHYAGERIVIIAFGTIASFAIFLAILGLFGLSSFSAELRKKEVGIRRVLGSPMGKVIMLLNKEFILLVLIANVIAIPVSFLIINESLSIYAYHTAINPFAFVTSFLITLTVTFLTVTFHSFKAALQNPANTLRNE